MPRKPDRFSEQGTLKRGAPRIEFGARSKSRMYWRLRDKRAGARWPDKPKQRIAAGATGRLLIRLPNSKGGIFPAFFFSRTVMKHGA
jgi:hypothetical protein